MLESKIAIKGEEIIKGKGNEQNIDISSSDSSVGDTAIILAAQRPGIEKDFSETRRDRIQ